MHCTANEDVPSLHAASCEQCISLVFMYVNTATGQCTTFSLTHHHLSRKLTTMKTFKKITSKVTKHNDDHPQGSQSTMSSHNQDQSADKALSALIFSVGAAEKVLDDLHVPGLTAAVGGLLEALKTIKVCSQYMHFYSYIMC